MAIIASILLAFWIQAWWEGLQRQGDERIFLQSLLDDLNQKKVQLKRDQRYIDTIFASTATLLQSATDAERRLEPGKVDPLIGDILWYQSAADWDSAPMNSLSMGGDSVQVSNAILLRKLVMLQNSFAKLRGNYESDKRFHYESLAPFLMSHVNLAQIYASIEHSPGDPAAIFEFPEITVSRNRDNMTLLSRDDFQGLLVIKIDLLLDIYRTIRTSRLEEQLDEITAMLERELAD